MTQKLLNFRLPCPRDSQLAVFRAPHTLASESLGQSDDSPTVLAAELRGELGAKSNMPPAATSIGLRSRSDSRIIRPLS